MFYFHPIRLKEPPIFNFPSLDSAKYFYKMAATAGPSCSEMGLNFLKTRIVAFLWSTSQNNWMGKLDCVNANIFHHTQKKFEMIIGPKLDRVNRTLGINGMKPYLFLHLLVMGMFQAPLVQLCLWYSYIPLIYAHRICC